MQSLGTTRCAAHSRGSTAACSSACPQRQQQQHRRTLTVLRFQQAQQSDTATALRKAQQGGSKPADVVGIPAPQEMQASVMLVPKESASKNLLKQAAASDSPLNSFLVKCRLAWNLFFPPGKSSAATRQLSPKELGKQRLSMILVADRCGLSPNSLVEMKRSTLAALQDCMDLEDLQDAHLRFTMTRENGVTYSMAVPILRPDADGAEDAEFDEADMSAAAAGAASWKEFTEAEYEQLTEDGGVYSSNTSVDDQDMPAAMRTTSPAAGMAAAVSAGSPVNALQADSSDQRLTAIALATNAGAAADFQVTTATTGELSAAAATASGKPAGWGSAAAEAAATGSRTASRAASHAASRTGRSRGASPVVELPLEGTAVMTPDMLKVLLVEELVHDVEELVEHMGPQAAVRAVEAGDGVLVIEPTAGAADAGEAGVLAEQLEAAVAEVQHFGEGTGASGVDVAPEGPEAKLGH